MNFTTKTVTGFYMSSFCHVHSALLSKVSCVKSCFSGSTPHSQPFGNASYKLPKAVCSVLISIALIFMDVIEVIVVIEIITSATYLRHSHSYAARVQESQVLQHDATTVHTGSRLEPTVFQYAYVTDLRRRHAMLDALVSKL